MTREWCWIYNCSSLDSRDTEQGSSSLSLAGAGGGTEPVVASVDWWPEVSSGQVSTSWWHQQHLGSGWSSVCILGHTVISRIQDSDTCEQFTTS